MTKTFQFVKKFNRQTLHKRKKLSRLYCMDADEIPLRKSKVTKTYWLSLIVHSSILSDDTKSRMYRYDHAIKCVEDERHCRLQSVSIDDRSF